MLESLMKVADFPKLVFDPTGFDFLLEPAQHSGGRIVFLQRFESSFGCQHAALDGQVNSLKALRVEEASGVAEDHPAVACDRRNRPPATVWQRLRAIADHLAAFQQLRNKRMMLEILQHVLRIKAGVRIIEAGDKAERNDVVFSTVDPGAAIF